MNQSKNTTAARPQVVASIEELRSASMAARASGKRIGLVPTMGALHQGHASLVEAARRECDFVIVTIFVNPAQFGPQEDFAKYPRTLETDLRMLGELGADLVFTPSAETMYLPGHSTYVDPGPLAKVLEGAIRPDHFRGVATIVLKLFNVAGADVAYFGQKDYQQSLIIRRMVAELNVPIEIQVCDTVREPDGLAMSSRNRYLSPVELENAVAVSRSLNLAAELVSRGERNANEVARRMREVVEAAGLDIDYILLADPDKLEEVETIQGSTVALVAARVGATRLIDNAILTPN